MPTLAEMKERVRFAMGRGDTFDPSISYLLEDTLRYIMGQHTFREMERWVGFTFGPEDDYPDRIGLPADVKQVLWMRVDVGGDWVWPVEVFDPKDMIREEGPPNGYWMDSTDQLILDNIPDQEYDGELYFAELTGFPQSEDSTHWLFNKAPQLCVAGVMIWLGPYMRETEGQVYGMWQSIFERELRDLIMQDEELRAGNKTWEMNNGYSLPWQGNN